MIKAVVFDIEGTIGDIAFVRDVLFPFARTRLHNFFESQWNGVELRDILSDARRESGLTLQCPDEAAKLFESWIDADKKITPLKSLQGLIWRKGYKSGELKAHLYPDAVEAFKRYTAADHRLCIYSSGSIEAQKLYLTHSIAGDLTSYFTDYFDTTTGPKADRDSYNKIANSISLAPQEIAFFSDARAEIGAASEAGFTAIHVVRDAVATGVPAFHTIKSFAEISKL